MPRQIKVYTASKIRHAATLLGLRATHDGFHLNARWLDTGNLASNSAKPVSHWLEENFDDIRAADYVLVYAEAGEHLKTALVEVGFALAYGKPVYVVGKTDGAVSENPEAMLGGHPDFAPWCMYSQLIHRMPTLQAALDHMREKETGKVVPIGRGAGTATQSV